MAPKGKKAGKRKPADDDDFWDTLAPKSGDATPAAAGSDAEEEDLVPVRPAPKGGKNKRGGGGGFASFADMMVEGDDDEEEAEEEAKPASKPAAVVQDDDDEEEDGLLAMAKKAAAKGGKKGKKGKKAQQSVGDDDYFDPNADAAAEAKDEEPEVDLAAPRGAVEVTDDWMEEEFGPTKKKGGKAAKKGGKKGQQQQQANEDDEQVAAVTEQVKEVKIDDADTEKKASAAPEAPEAANGGDGEIKILSKKEKEKLKKEKEKAKKKAQAAAKKAEAGTAAPTPAPAAAAAAAEAPATPAAAEDEGAAEDGGEASASAKNKKKKKKKAAGAAEPVEEAAPAKKGKGGGAQIAALRALMEAQQKAREEAERAEEEERRRIEEEERAAEEEERKKEEARLAKKEKERGKKEQLKREGKLLTPKQKAERAAAEARRQALLSAGNVTIAGLQQQEADAPRKVSYGKRERANNKKPAAPASPAEEKAPAAAAEAKKEEEKAAPAQAQAEEKKDDEQEDVKDSWDASSSEDEAKADVKDSWDASSDEEEEEQEEKKKPAPAAAPAGKANGKAAGAAEKAVPAKGKPAAKGKAAESSSEEEEDSEDGSGDDSDDSDSDSEDDSDDDSDEDDSDEEMTAVERQEAQRRAEAKARREERDRQALAERSTENLRSPICVIMGHVDTGKTKLLDKIRQTNVQEGEAGGITQQIGATYFPMDAIQKRTRVLGDDDLKEYKLPGLLVIDTPGHESFTNLRQRGSSLCNIAILVVDIMHGLEPQTLESIRLLREGKTPFIVALNKIDRLYGWKPMKDGGFRQTLAQQERPVQREFENRLNEAIVAFAEQGLNAVPYYDNKNFSKYVSLVPTSAHTGEGVPDLLMLLIKLTQERMANNLMYISTLQCTVLEVKVIEGLGTTIDVVLVNGYLHEGDKIVLCGLNGAIVTQVRALLTPQPMKELRIKGQYVHHKQIKAAMGVKIVAPDLEKAIAGSRLLVCSEDDDEDELREEVMSDLTNLLNSVDTSGRGVFVQASTLGSLEALLEFLKSDAVKIPVAGINIGPVHRKDVMRCATMLERAPELAVILCFDVAVDKDAERQAEELGVRIFKADIIYHLFDQFLAYRKGIEAKKEQEAAGKAVFPCRLNILACFAQRDPIILGCDIIEGSLRIGTPLCVVKTDPKTKKREVISLGKVTSLEINHKAKEIVKKHEVGAGVAVKIEHAAYENAKQYGRHFDDKDEVISMLSRESIDVLKNVFRKQVSMDEWRLIKNLKPLLDID
ncbi:hypothetical protein JCM8115_006845 [Rhodotorula mucilaginosa]